MNKIILNTILYIFLAGTIQAQIPLDGENEFFVENIYENVNLFTDRDLYLSGEDIWFTSFVMINNYFGENNLSKILYVELIDGKKKLIYSGKFEIRKGQSAGSIQIPFGTLTGNYFIRAYTLYNRNFSTDCYYTRLITIINPELPLPQEVQNDSAAFMGKMDLVSQVQLSAELKNIMVETDKAVYEKRDPLELKIKIPDSDIDEMAGLCVSVVRKGTFRGFEKFNDSIVASDNIRNEDSDPAFWIPETRGVSISGTVLEGSSQKPLPGLNVYLSVLGETPQLLISQTKDNGAFIFSLGSTSGINEIFLGVDPADCGDVRISVNNNFSNNFSHLDVVPISIDTNYKNLLEEMFVNHQTQLLFSSEKIKLSNAPGKAFKVFNNPDISIRLADYIDLPNIEAVFHELVPTVKVRDKNGQITINVFDPKTEIIFPNQLFLLDHVPVFDYNAAFDIPPFRIDNIEVVNGTYYLGDNVFRNVVMLNSKAQDFAGYNFPEGSIFVDYQCLSKEKKFISPLYKYQSAKNSRIPDFRTLLYWDPQINISATDTTLRFYTSDNSGVYNIFVRGFTKNGNPCFGKGSIRIQ